MDKEMAAARLQACGIPFGQDLPGKLVTYHNMLLDWNSRMDLTAVTEEEEMLDRHYIDSLMILTTERVPAQGASLIDVGTGAGFPGLPLALARPDLQVTLLDAQQKRLTFLSAVVEELKIRNVTLVHDRAEDGARRSELRERFDLAVARAVAPLNVLSEYLLPYVRQNGYAVCWKGPALAEEMEKGKNAAGILGGQVEEYLPCAIPGRDWQHGLLTIRKVKATPKAYPRKAGTPKSKPLG